MNGEKINCATAKNKKQISAIFAGFIDANIIHLSQQFWEYRNDDTKTYDINQKGYKNKANSRFFITNLHVYYK